MSTPTPPPGDAGRPEAPTEPLDATPAPAAGHVSAQSYAAPYPTDVPAGYVPPTAPAPASTWRQRRFAVSPLGAGIVAVVLLVVGFGGGAVTQKAFGHSNPQFNRVRFGPGAHGEFSGGMAPRGFGQRGNGNGNGDGNGNGNGNNRPGFGSGQRGFGPGQLPGQGATPGQRPTSQPSPSATGSGT